MFKQKLSEIQGLINSKIEEYFTEKLEEAAKENRNKAYCQLIEAMQYATLAGGKRLRPFLVMAFEEMFSGDNKKAIEVGMAVEFMHNYSLVHDDLPGLDNDDYRRGKLTCHKKYNEYTAILAGDALLTLVFEYISGIGGVDADTKIKLIKEISVATGFAGMCGGQMIDMFYEKERLSNEISPELKHEIDKLKTGKLFTACCRMGAILGGATDEQLVYVEGFAESFGEAFQLRDDLEDEEVLEKNKEAVKEKIAELKLQAKENLDKLSLNDKLLKELLDYLY